MVVVPCDRCGHGGLFCYSALNALIAGCGSGVVSVSTNRTMFPRVAVAVRVIPPPSSGRTNIGIALGSPYMGLSYAIAISVRD